ncbi:MAG: DUF3047 domain-containing protein [Gemmatimonadaceae bacterium]|nr:DUF3047 domain-containing protein [Gemmatimonadaceae bacterium]
MWLVMMLLTLVGTAPLRLLDLADAPIGQGVPAAWKVRSVRGQRPPEIEVRNDGDGPVLRMHGTGRAAWFYHELSEALPESIGKLHWSWRVLQAPAMADLRVEALDDSPIRVYVVFGKPGWFGGSARILFYSYGNAEPANVDRPSFGSDRLRVIRLDGVAEQRRWLEHAVEPFADYRRIWHRAPPPITAVGVMQDTDQTRGAASAELRRLDWIPGEASERRAAP